MSALAWRGIARGIPLLAALGGAALVLAAVDAAGRPIPAGALPALALGAGIAALRGPWSAATPIARALAGLALGLLAAPLACAWPGLAGIAVALLAVGALTPALDAALARRARGRRVAAVAGPAHADPADHTGGALSPGAAAATGAALGALLVAGLLALVALEAVLGGGPAR
jgi:hypothetical protein